MKNELTPQPSELYKSPTEAKCISRILATIGNFLDYKGAGMPAEVLLEMHDDLWIANKVVEQFTDEQGKLDASLTEETLREMSTDNHRIVSFLARLFDEYRIWEVVRGKISTP